MKQNKNLLSEISPQYIVNEKGKKISVVLDIKTFEKMVDEIEDNYYGAEVTKLMKKKGEIISHEEVKRKFLKK